MSPSEFTHVTDTKIGHELARDEDGRLYSVGMRELFQPLEVDMSAADEEMERSQGADSGQEEREVAGVRA
jgi:hypothetical protein